MLFFQLESLSAPMDAINAFIAGKMSELVLIFQIIVISSICYL